MKKKALRFISTVLTAVLLATAVPALPAAAISEVDEPAKVTSFCSSTDFNKELLRAWTVEDNTQLKISYKTPLQTSLFNLSLYRTGENKGNLKLNILIEPDLTVAEDGTTQYSFLYYLNLDDYDIPNGYYNLYIRRYATAEDAAALKYGTAGVLYKNMEVKITNGTIRILRYKDVIQNNREARELAANYAIENYLDNTLEDIRFVLKDPKTKNSDNIVYYDMTDDKISYIKQVSDRITAGMSSNYEKLLKIYEYTASNFYYDSVAFQTASNQYAHPYDNIRNFEMGLSSANSQQGKVATTCQGYSAIFLALARAQGIPVRFVYGHHLSIPSNDWLTEDNIDQRDHWWCEAYVNGKWIFVDPTTGTTNKHNSRTGVWTYNGLTNYTFFDPSEEQIATSHAYMKVFPDYRFPKWLKDTYEVTTLHSFLETWNEAKSKSNGQLLSSDYVGSDLSTWGDGTLGHFMTNGRGNTAKISWNAKGFTGAMNLPNFKKMQSFSAYKNKLTSVDLSGCSSLQKVYLYNNQLESVDLSDSPKLSYVRVQNNPMKSLKMYVNGRNRTFRAEENGTFYFTYDKRYKKTSFSLYSTPDIGYKLDGVYSTGTGNRLSRKTTWHFTPQAVGYASRFTLNPNSYKYTLTEGDASAKKLPYVQAAAKRLAALGYYTPSGYTYGSDYNYGDTQPAAGEETSFTAQMTEAVVKFQVMNDLPNTGIIDKATWSLLFSKAAAQMAASDVEYQEILAAYEARKAAEAPVQEELDQVTVKASSTAVKGAMKLSWSAVIPADALTTQTIGIGTDNGGTTVLDPIGTDSSAADVSASEDPAASDAAIVSYAADGYEVWKSKSKTTGYTLLKDTAGTSLKNTSGLIKGKRYYYKVRAYKIVGEKKLYTGWSNVTYKVAK